MSRDEWDEDEDEWGEDEDEDEWDEDEDEDEDEDLDENGETEEESMRRQEYMDENYPNVWLEESLSDADKLAMMEENECSECGGTIETELDTSEENFVACSSCGKEYVHCSSCFGYYDAFLMECPNDHS